MSVDRPCENQKPKRLYLLWSGSYYLSANGHDGALLSYTNKESAEQAAINELAEHGVESIPVRVR